MTKRGGKDMMNTANKELQEEMVGVLTAISIVSKRLANRLIELEEDEMQDTAEKREEKTNE
jgi:hypothetical protein